MTHHTLEQHSYLAVHQPVLSTLVSMYVQMQLDMRSKLCMNATYLAKN